MINLEKIPIVNEKTKNQNDIGIVSEKIKNIGEGIKNIKKEIDKLSKPINFSNKLKGLSIWQKIQLRRKLYSDYLKEKKENAKQLKDKKEILKNKTKKLENEIKQKQQITKKINKNIDDINSFDRDIETLNNKLISLNIEIIEIEKQLNILDNETSETTKEIDLLEDKMINNQDNIDNNIVNQNIEKDNMNNFFTELNNILKNNDLEPITKSIENVKKTHKKYKIILKDFIKTNKIKFDTIKTPEIKFADKTFDSSHKKYMLFDDNLKDNDIEKYKYYEIPQNVLNEKKQYICDNKDTLTYSKKLETSINQMCDNNKIINACLLHYNDGKITDANSSFSLIKNKCYNKTPFTSSVPYTSL